MENSFILSFIISAIIASSPLIAAALGGMFSEKSGIVNIGLEGIMTFSAFSSAIMLVFVQTNFGIFGFLSLLIGLISGIVGGVLFAYLHGLLTIKFKVDQIISGTIINILGLALALFLTSVITGGSASTDYNQAFAIRIFNIPLIVYFTLLLVPLTYYVINYTKWGLRLKSCAWLCCHFLAVTPCF